MNKKILIAIQDPDRRARLARIVSDIPGFRVVGHTECLMTTFATVEEALPQGVLISDNLAALPEFEVMRALFETLDVRWLIVRSPGFSKQDRYANGFKSVGSDLFSIDIDMSPSELGRALDELTRSEQSGLQSNRKFQSDKLNIHRMLLIGASTGGIDALLQILSKFPSNCPPTLVVQHTGPGFGRSFCQLLSRQCAPQITLATKPVPLAEGQVILGAGTEAHLTLQHSKTLLAALEVSPPISGHRPSVDRLFKSAVPYARRIAAVVLTGMGKDGADGLLALRNSGALTFAQDEASSTVYGMPKAAVENGAAETVLPLSEISAALIAAAQTPSAPARKAML